jgi:pullulanase/glycogen debranching enzyme
VAKRLGFLTLALVALAWTGCGGGSGSGSGGGASLTVDTDPAATPAADASYFKVPSIALGAAVANGAVTFTHWNPSAGSVKVNLYAKWNDPLSAPAATIPLTKGAGGVWSSGAVPLPAQAYYALDAGGTLVLDPYARSMAQWLHTGADSIPGDTLGKGAILDPSATGPDGGWTPYGGSSYYFDGSAMKAADGATPAPYAFAANRDAIIYEAGIRDLTVDPALTGFKAGHPWGTYKGLVDLLPHIQKLGVTHVQLLCPLENYTYDQTKIGTREMDASITSGANYNWGYDPQNYFTPTGMYSANPGDPVARVNELKTLINEIHKQGMGVILDVVYNHTANNAVLGDAANPGYFYRNSSKNGAGSNDVQTEHKMVRKLIVDSIHQWVVDYKVDGFRFDLMGVLDTQTVKDAYGAATAANPHAVFLGEGWNGFYTGSGTDYNGDPISGSDQAHASAFAGMNVAMFSDAYRQIFKNGYPNDGGTAFLTGASQSLADLLANVSGRPTNFTAPSTSNVVNYLTCHDNLCLYDVLSLATGASKAQDATVLKRAKVGYAVLLTSQGTAFLHAGDEMFRTKETPAGSGASNTKSGSGRTFVDNSYNASDAINMVAWSRVYSGDPITGGFTNYATAQNGYQLYRYAQGLIALRRSTNAFRLPDASIAANVTALPPTGAGSSGLAFGYRAASTDGTGTYFVFHNADQTAKTFPVTASLSSATLLADGASAGLTAITGSSTATLSADGLTVTVAPLTSAIFKQ